MSIAETKERETPKIGNIALAREIMKAIRRLRKRKQRIVQRIADSPFAEDKHKGDEPEGVWVARMHLGSVLDLILDTMEMELPGLDPRLQPYVLRHYGLTSFFPRVEPTPDLEAKMKPETLRKNVYRARKRLCAAVETNLQRQVEDGIASGREELYQHALAVVRGERILPAIEQLLEWNPELRT